MKNIALIIAVLLLTSCTHWMNRKLREDRCNATYAMNRGTLDAKNANLNRPGLQEGLICTDEDYTAANFDYDYDAGFRAYQTSYCSKNGMHDDAVSIANALTVIGNRTPNLDVCKELDVDAEVLKTAFASRFKQSICTNSQMTRIANLDAAGFYTDQTNAIQEFGRVCGPQNTQGLAQAYHEVYQRQMRVQCASVASFQAGSKDAINKMDIDKGIERLTKCPTDLQAAAVQSYSQGYQTTHTRLMEEERIRLEKERIRQEQEFQREQLRQQKLLLEQKRMQNSTACSISRSSATVTVFNNSSESQSLNGRWNVRFFNAHGFSTSDENTYQYLYVYSKGTANFTIRAPYGATSCSATYKS